MTTKRIKDGLLTSLIVLTLLCAAASFASFSGGAGAAGGPLVIETSADLRVLAEKVNSGDSCGGKVIILSNDIDLGGSANQWTPIGTEANPFSGTFDGNGHTISGLYINAASNDMQGLFGYVSGDAAEIRGLTVSGDVTGRYEVGIIVGHILGGTITNCAVSGTVSAGTKDGNSNAGGIAGHNDTGRISNCVSACGAVSGTGNNVGGVVGNNGGPRGSVSTVENCTASCDVVSGDGNVGGIAGQSDYGNITNCASTCGTVSGGGTDVGGVVGRNHGGNPGSTVSNCGWQKDNAHGVSADRHIGAGGGASFDVISYDAGSADKVAVTCLPDKYSLTLTNGASADVALTTYPHNNPGNIKSDPAPTVSPDIASASYSGGKITVTGTAPGTGRVTSIKFRPTHFSGNLDGCSADVTLNPQIALTVTAVPTPPTPPAGGSSGGCSAGFAALALLAAAPVVVRRKKRS